MSLRRRVSDLIDQAPLSRRLWFAPPMKVSLAVVGAVAVLMLAVILVGSQLVGPAPSQTPEPSASAGEPAPSAQATATPQPTPVPTPGVAVWSGLDWTAGSVDPGSWWVINDVLPWRGGYVGVGETRHRDTSAEPGTWHLTSAAFFTSTDGLRWTLAQEDEPIDLNSGSEDWLPARVMPVGDALLAVGFHRDSATPKLWRSDSGSVWSPLDSQTWHDLWLPPNHLLSIAAGPAGLVALGEQKLDCCTLGPAVVAHSTDGASWDRLDQPSVFARAYAWDVTAYESGFVIVGRVGEPDAVGAEPAIGKPAAWISPDGVAWASADVEGGQGAGARLETVTAGANGLFATGHQADATEPSGQGPLSGWASTDGRTWQLMGELGTDLPLASGDPATVAGDGEHMVMFGRESCRTTELRAWTSLDGVTWTQLAFSGGTSYLPIVPGPICNDDGTEGAIVGAVSVANAIVMPYGVFVITTSSAPIPPGYWFLAASTD
jgi:hypothetical protein